MGDRVGEVSGGFSDPSIVIVTGRSGYPHGTGAAARIRTWAKGFESEGYRPWVIALKPSEAPVGESRNRDAEGTADGVGFAYACGTVRAARGIGGKVALFLRGHVGLWRHLMRVRRGGPILAIHYYTPEHPTFVVASFLAARFLGAKFIGERTEAVTATRSRWVPFFERHVYRLFDGFVVISQHLRGYVEPRLRRGVPLINVPIQVDTDLFCPPSGDGEQRENSIVYCGAIVGNDDVTNLLAVFADTARPGGDWRLSVIGPAPSDVATDLRRRAEALGIGPSVEFTGALPATEVAGRLRRAKVAVLPRSAGLTSLAGFPTKLGEYLASGCTTIVTSTGDISTFLSDGVDAILVEPGDWKAFSVRLREVMDRYDLFRALGEAGRMAALRHFDYRAGCRRVLEAMGMERHEADSLPRLRT